MAIFSMDLFFNNIFQYHFSGGGETYVIESMDISTIDLINDSELDCTSCVYGVTITSDPMPAIITGGRSETYSIDFCALGVTYGVAGTSQEVATAVTTLLNENAGTIPGMAGSFIDNGDGTISFSGDLCNCTSPVFNVQLLGGA